MTAIFVAEVVGFIKHNQIRVDVVAASQGIEKLIAIYFSRTDYQLGIGVVLAIAGKYPYPVFAKLFCKLLVPGIRQGFQRRRVPRTTSCFQQASDLFPRDPGLAATGRSRYQHIFKLHRQQALPVETDRA